MPRALRIGIFVVAFPRASETFIVTKVLKLLERGFDVHIFALTHSSDWSRFAVLDGRDDVRRRLHVAPAMGSLGRVATKGGFQLAQTALSHPGSFGRLAVHSWRHRDESTTGAAKSLYEHAMFAKFELDVLHIEFDYQAIGVADLKEHLGCRLLLSARGTFQKSSTYTPAACEYLFRYVDGYHFISRYLEDNTRKLGLPVDVPSWQVEPAIDLTLFKPVHRLARTGDRPLRIISIGRLRWQKGYEFAIDTAARLRDLGVDFTYEIYGEGPYEQALAFAIRHHRLEDRVRLMGARPREEVPRLLEAADVMLHAAIEEGFCNAVIEAQAMEVPVVTSDAGGLPENVEDGVTGFVVPRRDPAALADKLAMIARDPVLERALGTAGRARALEHFDLERQAEAFVRVYEELMSYPRRGMR